jgi:hypothetical protein
MESTLDSNVPQETLDTQGNNTETLPTNNDLNVTEPEATVAKTETVADSAVDPKQAELDRIISKRLAQEKRAHRREIDELQKNHSSELESIKQILASHGQVLQPALQPHIQAPQDDVTLVKNLIRSEALSLLQEQKDVQQAQLREQEQHRFQNDLQTSVKDIEDRLDKLDDVYPDIDQVRHKIPIEAKQMATTIRYAEPVLYKLAKDPELMNKFNSLSILGKSRLLNDLNADVAAEVATQSTARYKSDTPRPLGSIPATGTLALSGERNSLDPTIHRKNKQAALAAKYGR